MILQQLSPPASLDHRLAIMAVFADPIPQACAALAELPDRDWARLLQWLDMSGLALYLLDHLKSRGLAHWLPHRILVALEGRAADARIRLGELIADFGAVDQSFRRLGLSYAVLKGFSLWPGSVPKMELRSQLDLDYLIATNDAPTARAVLESFGYALRAISGRSWEFKSSEAPCHSLTEMYKPGRQRSIELHLEEPGTSTSLLSTFVEQRVLYGVDAPVLLPANLFLGQALHLYKHIADGCWRAAHLLELYRHIQLRYHDVSFWREVQSLASQQSSAAEALGLTLLVLDEVMGDCAPDALTSWTINQVPAGAQAWVHVYGKRSALGDHPGTKLYLLLAREMSATGLKPRRSPSAALVPRCLPPRAFHPVTGETTRMRFSRNLRESQYRLMRLRFHSCEGVRYLWELMLWPGRVRRFTTWSVQQQAPHAASPRRPAASPPPLR